MITPHFAPSKDPLALPISKLSLQWFSAINFQGLQRLPPSLDPANFVSNYQCTYSQQTVTHPSFLRVSEHAVKMVEMSLLDTHAHVRLLQSEHACEISVHRHILSIDKALNNILQEGQSDSHLSHSSTYLHLERH